jgi:hypothetical protein
MLLIKFGITYIKKNYEVEQSTCCYVYKVICLKLCLYIYIQYDVSERQSNF